MLPDEQQAQPLEPMPPPEPDLPDPKIPEYRGDEPPTEITFTPEHPQK